MPVSVLQHRAPSQSAIIPALLLFSQIMLTSMPSGKASFVSDRNISPLSSDNTIYLDKSFNVLLKSVVNAL